MEFRMKSLADKEHENMEAIIRLASLNEALQGQYDEFQRQLNSTPSEKSTDFGAKSLLVAELKDKSIEGM